MSSGNFFLVKLYLVIISFFDHYLCRFLFLVLKCGPIPKHVAFIMDGNRRFAEKKKISRKMGHLKGFEKLLETTEWCYNLGVQILTIYAFSMENFKRKQEEVDYLMNMAKEKVDELLDESQFFEKNEICVNIVGDLSMLPPDLQKKFAEVVYRTRNHKKKVLNVCFSYTSHLEMKRAVSVLKESVVCNIIEPQNITEDCFEKCLYVNERVDLLIRTSGEVRFSDFLLWQASFAYCAFPKQFWPEFSLLTFVSIVLFYQHYYIYLQKKLNLHLSSVEASENLKILKEFADNKRKQEINQLLKLC